MSDDARMSGRRQQLGAFGEDCVAQWYEARGFEVVDRNWRVREGEIDLVVRHGRLIVFCEVKTRSSDRFGTPLEAVTAVKQRRLRTLAVRWLSEHPGRRGEIRFDVASVMPAGASPDVSVIEAAF